jgi:hypothetical protein
MTKKYTERTPGSIDWAIEQVNLQSGFKVLEFLASGAMANELGIDWEPPLVEHSGGAVIVHERMRFL